MQGALEANEQVVPESRMNMKVIMHYGDTGLCVVYTHKYTQLP